MFRTNLIALACVAVLGACPLSAQESSEAQKASDAPVSVTLTADGQLVGNAFAKVGDKEQPVEAKITLTKNGVVVGSRYAQEDGSFAFPSVEPGVYKMYGSAASYVGGTTLTVLPTAAVSKPVALPMTTFSPTTYATMAAAPAQACGCSQGVSSFGGGGYGGGGFSGGGFSGGGFSGGGFSGGGFGGSGLAGGLRGSRFLQLAVIGGVVGGVVGSSDSSPDN